MKKSPKEIVDMALAFSDNLIEKMSQDPENAQLVADYQKLKNDIENELKDDTTIEKFSAKKLAAFGILRKFSKTCDVKKFGEICEKIKAEGVDPQVVDAVQSKVEGNPHTEYMDMLTNLADNPEAKEIADSVEVTEENAVDKLKEFSVEEPQDALNVGIKFVEQMLDKMKNADDKDEEAIKNTEAALDAMKKYMDKPETKEFAGKKKMSDFQKLSYAISYKQAAEAADQAQKEGNEDLYEQASEYLQDMMDSGFVMPNEWKNKSVDDLQKMMKNAVKEFAASKSKYDSLNDNLLLNLIHSLKTNIAINEQAMSELSKDEKEIKDDIEADTKKFRDQLDEMMKVAKDRKIDSQVQKVTLEFSSEDVVPTPDVIPDEHEDKIPEVKPEIVVDYDPENDEISIN